MTNYAVSCELSRIVDIQREMDALVAQSKKRYEAAIKADDIAGMRAEMLELDRLDRFYSERIAEVLINKAALQKQIDASFEDKPSPALPLAVAAIASVFIVLMITKLPW